MSGQRVEVRCEEDEAARWRAMAQERGVSLSDLVRLGLEALSQGDPAPRLSSDAVELGDEIPSGWTGPAWEERKRRAKAAAEWIHSLPVGAPFCPAHPFVEYDPAVWGRPEGQVCRRCGRKLERRSDRVYGEPVDA